MFPISFDCALWTEDLNRLFYVIFFIFTQLFATIPLSKLGALLFFFGSFFYFSHSVFFLSILLFIYKLLIRQRFQQKSVICVVNILRFNKAQWKITKDVAEKKERQRLYVYGWASGLIWCWCDDSVWWRPMCFCYMLH